ncbi:MAG: hypothetical protein N2169_06805 [bacterium]|nr:hypothetical protein [bacterium]
MKLISKFFYTFIFISLILSISNSQIQDTINENKEDQNWTDRTLEIRDKYEDKLRSYPVFNQKAFLPNISIITDFSYLNYNIDPDSSLIVPGFIVDTSLKDKGFNFNYNELSFYSSVDPYFDLYVTIPFEEDEVEVEEAYAVTRSLPSGLQLKIGKFRSSFGRLNSQHEHVWDFATSPLVYELLLSEEGLNEKGVQLNWVPATNFYLFTGIEILQGENELSFGTNKLLINTNINNTGQEIVIKSPTKPNLLVSFIKTSFDIGNTSILTGLSFANGESRFNSIEDNNFAFSGKTKMLNFELTAKHFIGSYKYISFQGEYIKRTQKGTEFEYDDMGDLLVNQYNSSQAGYYAQIVYRFDKRWKVGIQHNQIAENTIKINGESKILPSNLSSNYFVIEYNPTEFSRIRLQYGTKNHLFSDFERKKINEFIIQFNFAIGSHKTHPF